MPRRLPDSPSEPPVDPSGPVAFMRENPIAIAVLIVAMIAGAISGFYYLADTLSPMRSLLGGALAGFGCWLIVMAGRIIGD